MIHSLAGDAGAPLVEAAKLSSASIPGYVPDVLVTTPAALLSFWRNVSVGYPRGWMSRENLLASVRIVVLDEADLVLTGEAITEAGAGCGSTGWCMWWFLRDVVRGF